jgi:hypothetical protein
MRPEEAIDEEIGREVDGAGEIGELSKRITTYELKERDIYRSNIRYWLAARGRLLTGPYV